MNIPGDRLAHQAQAYVPNGQHESTPLEKRYGNYKPPLFLQAGEVLMELILKERAPKASIAPFFLHISRLIAYFNP